MTSELLLLTQTLVILLLPAAIWRPLRRVGMPLVVAQILVGIFLGPTCMGRFAPGLFHLFFNPATLAPLSGVAAIAVLFFAFVTGLHLDPRTFVGRGRGFVAIAAASVIVPTAAGFIAGLWIAARHPIEVAPWVGPVGFATAIGICTGVIALPVLGTILHEMNLLGRRIGDLALAAAAVNDAALWVLLAGLMTVLAGQTPGGPGILITLLGLPVYLAIMLRVVRPGLKRGMAVLLRDGDMSQNALVAICAICVGSAMISQWLGLHYIFGAFAAGALMPEELRRPLLQRLQMVTTGLLMPFFFMLSGLRTVVDFGSPGFVEIVLVTTLLAALGFSGIALTARISGESWADSCGLGVLLQTKGLMELVVLTVLYDRQIISQNVFSALVVMAMLSTMIVMPLTRLALGLGRARTRARSAVSDIASETAASPKSLSRWT